MFGWKRFFKISSSYLEQMGLYLSLYYVIIKGFIISNGKDVCIDAVHLGEEATTRDGNK